MMLMRDDLKILFCLTLLRVLDVVQSAANINQPDRSNRTNNGTQYLRAGEYCAPSDFKWYPMEDDPRKFLYCDRRTKTLMIDTCASVNNVPKIFDERMQKCVMPAQGKLRSPGIPRSSGFNEPCQFNTDCLSNMYCPTGVCVCIAGFIDSGPACIPVVAPGQTTCTGDRQCQAYWPITQCTTGQCLCVVPQDLTSPQPGQPAPAPPYYESVAVATPEGFVCQVNRITAAAVGGNFPKTQFCPMPIPNDDIATNPWPAGGIGAFAPPNPAVAPPGPAPAGNLFCTGPPALNCLNGNDNWNDMAYCMVSSATAAAAPALTYVCCPNRAHTCMQPKPQSIAALANGIVVLRFWYNQATGSCEQFQWDGRTPWANNFRLQEHCVSYCGGICPRGYTQVTNGAPTVFCPNNACTNPNACQTVPSAGRDLCCPTKGFICGAQQGRTFPAAPAVAPAQAGLPGSAITAPAAAVVPAVLTPRWEFTNGQCSPIAGQYTGWGGTYNNFGSRQECEGFCIAATCDRGQPLKDATGQNQACGRGCPSTYECKGGVCCPKKQTVCIEPQIIGTCSQSQTRFWYNAASRDCEQFVYTGCGGNDNNFETYQSCVTYCREVKSEPLCVQGQADKDSAGNYYTCTASASISTCRPNFECYFDGFSFGCCPQKAYTCGLNRQPGSPCLAPTSRWYFDVSTRSCQNFQYNGCDGNSNNFINRQECEKYCGVGGCPYGGDTFKEPTGAARICSSQNTCPSGYSCNLVGAGGSGVVNYCCMTKATICQQNPNQGTVCGPQVQRYYFNLATRQCSTFTYFGCGGNENNFATLAQCNNFCGSAACNDGEAVYVDPNSNRPLSCNPGLTTPCPNGYRCRSDPLTNINVCCGSNEFGVCPTGEKAYVESLTNTARECQPSVTSSCPNNYFCRPNALRNRYYCCATSASAICPTGKAVYLSPGASQPLACYISTINPCPQDYSCQPTTVGQLQGFCCTINALCPNNGEFFVDAATQQPRRCTVQAGGFNTCPDPYRCASNPIAGLPASTDGYCCRGGTVANLCQIGQPLIVGGVAQQCVPNQPPFCPASYACTASATGGGNFYCCSTGVVGDGCPTGTTAYLQPATNTPMLCASPSDTVCPTGYNCQLSPTLNRYQCCSGAATPTDGCPNGMRAFREQGTSAVRACTFGGTQCPPPYSCQSTNTGQLQCCGLTGGCPPPTVAIINPTTGQPLLCPTGAGCTAGSQCLQAAAGQLTCCGTGVVVPPPTRPPPPPTRLPRCPFPGQRPYVNPVTSQPQSCRVGVNTCPSGYECLNGGDGFFCCSNRGAPPPPQPPQPPPPPPPAPSNCWGTCTLGAPNACLPSYRCQSIGGVGHCCKITGRSINGPTSDAAPPPPVRPAPAGGGGATTPGSGCPNGGRAFLYPGTQQPVTCQLEANGQKSGTCPVGYSCARTTNRNICCSR